MITEYGVNMLIGDPVAVVYALRGNAAFRGRRGADKTGPFTDPHALLLYFFICNIFFSKLNTTMPPKDFRLLISGTHIGNFEHQKGALARTAPDSDASVPRAAAQEFKDLLA